MIFNIRDSWSNFDDYIADLSKKYRDQYKRSEKSRRNFEKKVISEEITNYNSRIYALYMNVAKNARLTPFIYLKPFYNFKKHY
jgi:predicted N-acyltransferase